MLRGARIRVRSEMMKTHEFTIVASGLDPEMDGYEDRFFEAGCDDGGPRIASFFYRGAAQPG